MNFITSHFDARVSSVHRHAAAALRIAACFYQN